MSAPAAPRLSGLERTLWPTVGLLAATLVLYEFTPLDLRLQDLLYDFTNRRWLVDARDPVWRVLFYTGPKQVIVVFGLALLALALGPSLTAIGKEYSNVFCPSEIRRYGGDVRYVKLCEPFPADDRPARRGHCFPAGHCSGGFALLGLGWLRPTPALAHGRHCTWTRGRLDHGALPDVQGRPLPQPHRDHHAAMLDCGGVLVPRAECGAGLANDQ